MPWKQTAEGRFQRPLDSIEDFHRAVKASSAALNREQYSIRATVTFRLNTPSIGDTVSVLRNAWKTMRYDFPQLAALDRDGTFVYEVPDEDTLDAWLSQSFVIEPQGSQTPEELYARLGPVDIAYMYYFPQTSQLMLHISHWRIDGRGAIYLFNHLLDAVAHPRTVYFGDEGKNLTIGLDEANNVPTHFTPQIEQAATDFLMKFVNNTPSIGLPAKTDNFLFGTDRCGIELDDALTSSIITRCKTRGFSVTVAVHAAIVCVTKQYADKESTAGKRKYASWTVFDLRKHSPPPYNGKDNVVSNFQTGIPIVITPSTFQDNADQLKKQYTENTIVTGPESIFTFLNCYVRKLCAMFTSPPPPDAIPPTEPSLNSLGIIDQYLAAKHGDNGEIEVLDFWVGVEMLTRQIMCYLWTWRGKMRLSLCYNQAFYETAFVEEFLSRVKDALIDGLDLKAHAEKGLERISSSLSSLVSELDWREENSRECRVIQTAIFNNA